jgi:Mg/Co/Ni transporter MgtE
MLTKNFEELWEIARAEGLVNSENQAELDEEETEAVATLLETLNDDKLDKVLAKLDSEKREKLIKLLTQKGQQG